jgi:hypothetical protein
VTRSKLSQPRRRQRRRLGIDLTRVQLSVTLIAAFFVLLWTPVAQASKQAVDFIGGSGTLGGEFGFEQGGIAVSETGAGPADAGDIYVADPPNNRIQRFGRDDNGTPANADDDTYFFISAWGIDVDSQAPGDSEYEVCVVASQCQKGTASAVNGGLAALQKNGLALDQDTGNLYVSDAGNYRVSVYSGDGTFLRSFGYDVVASGPGNIGTGYEVCVMADEDVCKAGLLGSGAGQIGAGTPPHFFDKGAVGIAVSAPDGNPATGTVFLADAGNRRIDSYSLDGASPSSFGAGQFPVSLLGVGQFLEPMMVAVDSRGIVYVEGGSTGNHRIERYDTLGVNGEGVGFIVPILFPQNDVQLLKEEATAGQFRLTFKGFTTGDLPFNASGAQISTALQALPSIGAGNVNLQQLNLGGIESFRIDFRGTLAVSDQPLIIVSNGTTPLTGSVSITTEWNGHPGLAPPTGPNALAVDPDTDGAGPDTDVLYADRGSAQFGRQIQQLGPLNPAGVSAPPPAVDDTHGTNGVHGSADGLAAEPSTGRLYVATEGIAGPGVYVLDNASLTSPTVTLDPIDGITSTSADLHATIDPNGPPATRYHFEYVDDATYQASGFTEAKSLPEQFLGTQEDPQAVTEHLEPPPVGLDPNTEYHVRVVAKRKLDPPVISNELIFTTLGTPPLVETAGAPVRTTATAQLNGRVTPLGTATTYHFEYGTDQSYGQSTTPMPAGSGLLTLLVAEEIEGLAPDTTYHYRLVADNGVGSPATGADMTVHTRASNQLPGQSDEFPGPPGSDRAWEQVSIAESSGNPVSVISETAFSDDGDRAAYSIAGGTPTSPTGSFESFYFAQRTPVGWQPVSLLPPREQMIGQIWRGFYGTDDLSQVITGNSEGTLVDLERTSLWQLSPEAGPSLLYGLPRGSETFGLSADGSLAVVPEGEALDPDYPALPRGGLYDVSSSPPRLLSLLPDDQPAPCGVEITQQVQKEERWMSPDGSLVYFQTRPGSPCDGAVGPPLQLYVRDLASEQTKLISGPALSGGDCGGGLVKAIGGAVFFVTATRLVAEDPAECGDPNAFDVYRYDTNDDSLDCVTCVIPGFSVGVNTGATGLLGGPSEVAVSGDGSRLYFTSDRHLVAGSPPVGQRGVYRVEVESGDLDYVAPRVNIGTARSDVALSSDGSTLAFTSDGAELNPLGGVSDNGGGIQYYRYDDNDRSLVCVSCPQDGSKPSAESSSFLQPAQSGAFHLNNRALSKDGGTIAFSTPVALVGADQNTPGAGQSPGAGEDVYEWRDGRQILVTDGLTNWPIAPLGLGVSADGSDVYFIAAAALTPDAPDALVRLYDARIGGGFHFPKPPPPCPLEVCQGTPKGAPEEQPPGTSDFRGPGNPGATTRPLRCPKGKRKVRRKGKVRCVKRQRAANQNRRAHR